MEQAQRHEAQMREYVRSVASPASTADELGKLADLQQRGVLTDAEYEQAKARLFGEPPGSTTLAGPPRRA
jgi:hypothetical protein